MPALSAWLIRLSLLHLLAGFTVGALLLAHKGISFAPSLWAWLPAHIDFLLFGWIVQLIMGTAFWILPRLGSAGRGNVGLAWLAFSLLNLGVLLASFGPLLGLGELVALGRAAELGAVLAFAVHAWPRIKPFGV